MKITLAIVSAAVLALAGAVVALAVQLGSLGSRVSGEQAAIVRARSALSREAAQLGQEAARINGSHRDLITCADLQALGFSVTGNDSYGGQLQASVAGPGPISLPQHCINR